MTVPSEEDTEFRGTPTTRCYPRTLQEAFPHSTDRAQWFYPPERHFTWGSFFYALFGFMLWGAVAYIFMEVL